MHSTIFNLPIPDHLIRVSKQYDNTEVLSKIALRCEVRGEVQSGLEIAMEMANQARDGVEPNVRRWGY